MIKVTFVGAGSIEFTRNVVTDLGGYPEFHGRLHLSLYDISTERLAHAERPARRIAAQTGCGAELTATADRRAAPDVPQRGRADRARCPGGVPDHVYQAALLDPDTAATLTTAGTVVRCDELFAAHRDLLPAAFTG